MHDFIHHRTRRFNALHELLTGLSASRMAATNAPDTHVSGASDAPRAAERSRTVAPGGRVLAAAASGAAHSLSREVVS